MPRRLGIAGLVVFAACFAGAGAEETGSVRGRLYWHGADGKPLPFADNEAIQEFLRTADVVDSKVISQGLNQPLKLTLDADGIQVHAVFRTVNADYMGGEMPDGTYLGDFRDSYVFEDVAYRLSNRLGIDRVPPTVQRSYQDRQGTLQLWVENATFEGTRSARGIEPPDPGDWAEQQLEQRIFDALIYNIDRNPANLLIDRDWKVWLIDHTRSFLPLRQALHLEEIVQCERGLWQRLRSLEPKQVTAELGPELRSSERRALAVRWRQMVEHFDTLIEQRGEAAVLFDRGDLGVPRPVEEALTPANGK